MDHGAYLERLRRYANVADVSEYGSVVEGGRRYPLVRLTVPGERMLVLTAGFHGEEPAGPLTLAEHFAEIAAYARSRKVGLVVFPCINPSGFEAGTRYNASGEKPNNDFLRYEVAPGKWRGELKSGESFLRWKPFAEGPKETRALLQALEALPCPVAALDIHQDNYTPRNVTYAYVFGDRRHYAPLSRAAARHIKLAVRVAVDDHNRTDRCGLIWFHDGSVTDYFMRRGTPYCAALETTTRTPMAACHAVNLIWIRGFIELAANHPAA